MTATSEESQQTPLRGRTNELRRIAEHVAGLSSGRGSVLLISGEAGLGKSELLRATASAARDSGLRVFYGASAVAAQSLPLAPLLDALIDSSEGGIDPVALRELGATEDQRYWLLRELEEQLEQAALQAPVLVALDDIQWADAATLSAISILPRRMVSHRILWALAVRSGDLLQTAHLAVSRLRRDGAAEIQLTRLDDAAVADVSRDILLGEPDNRLRTVLDRVEGQPLWLVELLRGLRDEQLVAVEAGVARLVGEGIPRRLLAGDVAGLVMEVARPQPRRSPQSRGPTARPPDTSAHITPKSLIAGYSGRAGLSVALAHPHGLSVFGDCSVSQQLAAPRTSEACFAGRVQPILNSASRRQRSPASAASGWLWQPIRECSCDDGGEARLRGG
jgi:ABC-type transport system involved in cytochrome c biogenesis ATPase subunit